ncbi:class I SAM-dependent methyltransferase [Falsochrobactrum shanghaiense]|uniref:class I SAM-dependent methyltransferase n=1 Tax=Falsochrobactrum shanghaiense TaxID=2201899 RepID=UPI001FE16960|nr:class I SAM-dependent methyltransferase [Falsochrobactrum shanghaiense]
MKKNKKAFKRKNDEHFALVKYIFPGGELDHLGMTIENREGHGVKIYDVDNLRENFAFPAARWLLNVVPYRSTKRSRQNANMAFSRLLKHVMIFS